MPTSEVYSFLIEGKLKDEHKKDLTSKFLKNTIIIIRNITFLFLFQLLKTQKTLHIHSTLKVLVEHLNIQILQQILKAV